MCIQRGRVGNEGGIIFNLFEVLELAVYSYKTYRRKLPNFLGFMENCLACMPATWKNLQQPRLVYQLELHYSCVLKNRNVKV